MLRIPVAKKILSRSEVHALVDKMPAALMPEHMWVDVP